MKYKGILWTIAAAGLAFIAPLYFFEFKTTTPFYVLGIVTSLATLLIGFHRIRLLWWGVKWTRWSKSLDIRGNSVIEWRSSSPEPNPLTEPWLHLDKEIKEAIYFVNWWEEQVTKSCDAIPTAEGFEQYEKSLEILRKSSETKNTDSAP